MTAKTRTCPLCEAMCGLQLDMDGDGRVKRVRGDREDVYSHGFVCPKGASFGRIESDPDRLARPLIRRGTTTTEVSWDEAFAEIDRLFSPLLEESGRDSIGVFLGNAMAHNFGIGLYLPTLLRAISTKQVYSSATLDNMPHNVAAALMFGNQGSIAVPDLDRTDLLVVVGGNPLVSNGSVGSAPDYKGRLEAMRDRGGRLVVVDPARTATAELADQHIALRPGADALFLIATVHALFDEELVRLGALEPHVAGAAELRAAVAPFTPERVADRCGVSASVIRQLARDLVAAPSAAVYGRLGTTLNRFGSLASWGLQLLNILTGHLDRPGGMMYPTPATGSPTTRAHTSAALPVEFGRYHSRVRGSPEVFGEFPAACMAEEILVPGQGRIRGMVVIGGNPARSVPNSSSVEEALASLDAMVCVDPYLNETSRFADVVLPPPSVLTRAHFDLVLTTYSLRNLTKFSEPLADLPADGLAEWQILLRLAGFFSGLGPQADVDAIDEQIRTKFVASVSRETKVPIEDVEASITCTGPEALLDLRLRSGPYGDLFGRNDSGLTLHRVRAAPHGIDLGPLESRIADVIRTPSGSIELAPPIFVADLDRLETQVSEPEAPGLSLIGRRHLRSKNSWLHNIPVLVSGRPRCTLQLNPDDAAALGVEDAGLATVTSETGTLTVEAEVTDVMARGVCSLPHGWGHDAAGTRMQEAKRKPGVNSNALATSFELDPLSGTATLNGVTVVVSAALAPESVDAGYSR